MPGPPVMDFESKRRALNPRVLLLRRVARVAASLRPATALRGWRGRIIGASLPLG
jgi:hypothetical protein